ncbi:response regulator transcription factor [Candidatus Hydrogenedentota bacterium]
MEQERAKILVVDDERHILDVLEYSLSKDGYEVVTASNGNEALEKVESESPDMLILDVMMPGPDGFEVCREMRAKSDVPIIILTARDDEIDRVLGLEIGADDYVTKPFSPREVVARVKALFRRVARQPDGEDISHSLACGNVRLDLEAHLAYSADTRVDLTETEFSILKTLVEHPGRVFTRENLMSQAYRYHSYSTARSIDTHIKRIRKKFHEIDESSDIVETVHGVGYRAREH